MNKDELLKEIRQMVREGLVLRRVLRSGDKVSKGTNKTYLYIESLFEQYGEPIFEDGHPCANKKGDE